MALLDDRVPWRTAAALGAVFALLAIAGTIGAGPAFLGWIGGSIAVVVLLPCVPATATTHLPRRTFSASHCGPET